MIMEHGGNIREAESQFGFSPGEMLDLSTGICPRPYPIPEHLLDPDEWRGLPQREDEEALESAIRSTYGIPDEAGIVAAAGSQALINTLPLMNRIKTKTVTLTNNIYSEHRLAWERAGYKIMKPELYHYGLRLKTATRNVVVVRPDNPRGHLHPRKRMFEFADQLVSHKGLVVVDEAFADLVPTKSLLPDTGRPALMVLRSFGKFFGLAGLRLGFAVGHQDDIVRLREKLGPWQASTPALRIGAAAIADTEFQDEQRKWIGDRHKALKKVLEERSLKIKGGTKLFVLLECQDAAGLHRHLAESGIWTRVFEDEPDWLRIGIPDEEGLEKLDEALEGWREGDETESIAS